MIAVAPTQRAVRLRVVSARTPIMEATCARVLYTAIIRADRGGRAARISAATSAQEVGQ
jgi:hypothetical protein